MSANYDNLQLYLQNQPQDSSKYFGLSVVVHTALIIGSFFVTVPLLESLKKEPITIEILDSKPEIPKPIIQSLQAPKGEKIEATSGAVKLNSPAPSAPLDSEIAKTVKAPAARSKKSAVKMAKLKTFTGGAVKPVAQAHTAVSRAGVPETIEDIAAPDLDFDGVVAAQQGKLGDNEFESEFKKVDHSNAAAVAAQKAELDNETKLVADEQDSALQSLEEDNKAQARAMDDAIKATRTKNAATLAAIKAAEMATAEKAAKQADLLAKASAAKAAGSGQAASGHGSDSSGVDRPSSAASGDPKGVRALEQLRQIPGNPKPQYATDERLRREQGQVAFHAYISKSGVPSDFRMMHSTGFRNLDGKTLAALKKWKFYPGQEGWVEIPFKWDLKGGVEEMPTTLRRFGSR